MAKVVQILRRSSGLVECVCDHGVGHPNDELSKEAGYIGDYIHGCDGCCSHTDFIPSDKLVKEFKEHGYTT